jgi:Ca-activated chloride channel homolog
MKFYFIIILTLLSMLLEAEVFTYEKVLQNRKGLQRFENEEFSEAEEVFKENAMNYPREGIMHFNHGNALYKAGKLEEAENSYRLALRDQKFQDKSKIYHNLGNVKFEQQDYKNALDYYRNALIENQNNEDARYNYELASHFLQRQQEQPQSSQSDEDGDNNEEQEEQQDQQQSDDGNQEQEQKEQQQIELSEEEQKRKEEAEQILRALQQKEKELMKEEKKPSDTNKQGKYW